MRIVDGWIVDDSRIVTAGVGRVDRASHPLPGGKATTILVHTNAGGLVTPEQFYRSMMNQLNAGNPETTIPHFQFGHDGRFAQYVRLDQGGVTCYHANGFVYGFECAGNVEPYYPPQAESMAQVMAILAPWANIPFARPVDRGTPSASWKASGIEGHCSSQTLNDGRGFMYPNTSNARGKICPGPLRIAQIDGIIARASAIHTPFIPPGPPAPTPGADMANKVIYTTGQASGMGIWVQDSGGLYHDPDGVYAGQLHADGDPIVYWDLGPLHAAQRRYGVTVSLARKAQKMAATHTAKNLDTLNTNLRAVGMPEYGLV